MISVKVYNRQLVPTAKWPITSGSAGLPVEFEFDEDWDGISRIAVFRGSGAAIDVPLLGSDSCVVPAEVLTEYGDNLLIGVYGENGAGNTVIPTVWGNAGLIKEGTEPSEISPSDPEPDWTAQVIAAAVAMFPSVRHGFYRSVQVGCVHAPLVGAVNRQVITVRQIGFTIDIATGIALAVQYSHPRFGLLSGSLPRCTGPHRCHHSRPS